MRNAQHWMDRANTTLPISHQSPQISSCFPPTSQTRLSIRLSRVPIFSLICYQRYQQHLFHKDSINRDYVEVGRWLTYNMTTSSSVLDIAIIKCLCFKCTDSSNIRVIIGYKKSLCVKGWCYVISKASEDTNKNSLNGWSICIRHKHDQTDMG